LDVWLEETLGFVLRFWDGATGNRALPTELTLGHGRARNYNYPCTLPGVPGCVNPFELPRLPVYRGAAMSILNLLVSNPAIGFAALLCLIAAFTVHEWAHAYVAYKLGDDTPMLDGRVTLNPLAHLDPVGSIAFLLVGFGWGKPVIINPMRLSRRVDELLVALAGPASNIAFAILLNLIAYLVQDQIVFSAFLRLGAFLNVSLAAFNLLPIPPLDGSSIIDYFYPGYKQLGSQIPILLIFLVIMYLPVGGSSLLRFIMQPLVAGLTYVTKLGGLI
jgi:Zn-dependent protease